jgi:diaminopimelate epimerase
MQFIKAHGAGNDFVLLPDHEDTFVLSAAFVRAVCDRHLGVGGDGVIRLAPGGGDSDVFMDYRNADGSVAEMCGNGVRCVAKYAADRGLVTGDVVRVGTRAGTKAVRVVERHADGRVSTVRVDMGAPAVVETQVLPVDGGDREATFVSMGNPHVVLVVDDVAAAPLASWAPQISRRFPQGANVEVIAPAGADRILGRIFERGVGETMASGTGGSAMAVAASVRGLSGRDVTVALPGGQLRVRWTEETLFVTGGAEEVAHGTLDESWLAARSASATQMPVDGGGVEQTV